MPNTGNVIVITLVEKSSPGGVPTGNTKPNSSTDPDYIAPYYNVTKCPVTYEFTCPALLATGVNNGIIFEYGLPNSVVLNPDIAKVRTKATLSGSTVSFIDIVLPNTNKNYFSGTITGLTNSTTYTLVVEYLDSGNAVLHTCGSLGNFTTTSTGTTTTTSTSTTSTTTTTTTTVGA